MSIMHSKYYLLTVWPNSCLFPTRAQKMGGAPPFLGGEVEDHTQIAPVSEYQTLPCLKRRATPSEDWGSYGPIPPASDRLLPPPPPVKAILGSA